MNSSVSLPLNEDQSFEVAGSFSSWRLVWTVIKANRQPNRNNFKSQCDFADKLVKRIGNTFLMWAMTIFVMRKRETEWHRVGIRIAIHETGARTRPSSHGCVYFTSDRNESCHRKRLHWTQLSLRRRPLHQGDASTKPQRRTDLPHHSPTDFVIAFYKQSSSTNSTKTGSRATATPAPSDHTLLQRFTFFHSCSRRAWTLVRELAKLLQVDHKHLQTVRHCTIVDEVQSLYFNIYLSLSVGRQSICVI